MNKAKAAVFMGANAPFEIREFDIAPTPSGYGRSELIVSGVCGTDLHFHNGKLAVGAPSIIGHEFIGRLVDLDEAEGAAYGLEVGDNVIADIAVPCGCCPLCKSGDDANCIHMAVTNGGSIEDAPYLWGGYTEVNYTPLSNLIKIPDELDPAMVGVFACPGPTAQHAFALAARAGVDMSTIQSAVVQGLGPVGMYAAMYLKAMGVEHVYAISGGKQPARESLVLELGIEKVFVLAEQTAEEINRELMALTDGLGVDLVFEASGAPSAVPQGMEILRNRGVYLIPGQYSNSGGISIQPQMITFKALHIIGASQYSVSDVKDYLTFLVEHPAYHDIIRRMAGRYAIEDVNAAFADAKAGKNVKTVLVKG